MFNRKAARSRNRPDIVMATLDLQPGQAIADLGSGGGYFCFRFADAVGSQGRIYAIDVETDFLAFIQAQALEKGVAHLITVPLADARRIIPRQSLDWLFLRNVYHHLDDRTVLLGEYRRSAPASSGMRWPLTGSSGTIWNRAKRITGSPPRRKIRTAAMPD
jgi:ubiquinone/menaquinone biosynthesis C-methylase UbiE